MAGKISRRSENAVPQRFPTHELHSPLLKGGKRGTYYAGGIENVNKKNDWKMLGLEREEDQPL
jgi:hypothetical protein